MFDPFGFLNRLSRASRWVLVALLSLNFISLGMAADDEQTNVPDPYGLGERLALVDYLRDHHIELAPAEDLASLRQKYYMLVPRHLVLSDGSTDEERAAADERYRREAYRKQVMDEFGVEVPPASTVLQIKEIERLAKEARAEKKVEEEAAARERKQKAESTGHGGEDTPKPGNRAADAVQREVPHDSTPTGQSFIAAALAKIPSESFPDLTARGERLYELQDLEQLQADGKATLLSHHVLLVATDSVIIGPGVVQFPYPMEAGDPVEYVRKNGFSGKIDVFRMRGRLRDYGAGEANIAILHRVREMEDDGREWFDYVSSDAKSQVSMGREGFCASVPGIIAKPGAYRVSYSQEGFNERLLPNGFTRLAPIFKVTNATAISP